MNGKALLCIQNEDASKPSPRTKSTVDYPEVKESEARQNKQNKL